LCVLSLSAGVTALADAISGNGALSHFDISSNSLYAAGAKAIAKGLKDNQVVTELNISGNGMGRRSITGSSDMSGVAALADVIPGMRAMTNLDMSGNDFYDTEAGKALGDMLAVNTVLKQLDLSDCNMQIESTKALAVGIRDNGAMTSLNLASNGLGIEGAKIVAAVLPKCM
jgi:Ran GTPase-activating protein (RanGAP) involved in mRNA processing and transport